MNTNHINEDNKWQTLLHESNQNDQVSENAPSCCHIAGDFIKYSGNDSIKFLQGQLTCDVVALTENNITLGACCNLQGRIIANFQLLKTEKEILISLPHHQGETLTSHLKRYQVFYKELSVEPMVSWLRFGVAVKDKKQALPIINKPFNSEQNCQKINNNLYIIKLHEKLDNITRFEFWVQDVAAKAFISELVTNCRVEDSHFWQLLDIDAGMVWVIPELKEKLIPQQVNFDSFNGISWNKGCFTGQEVIARLKYRGKIKTKLYKLILDTKSPQLPFTKILANDKSAGELICSAFNPKLDKTIALGVLREDATDKNLTLANNSIHIDIINEFSP